jgi:hypothetical protein
MVRCVPHQVSGSTRLDLSCGATFLPEDLTFAPLVLSLLRDRGFESRSLQERVRSEPGRWRSRHAAIAGAGWRTAWPAAVAVLGAPLPVRRRSTIFVWNVKQAHSEATQSAYTFQPGHDDGV